MKIFCDTNILMEFIQQRKLALEVERVLSFAESNAHQLYISVGSFFTTTYLVECYLKQEQLPKEIRLERLKSIMNGILDLFLFAQLSGETLSDGVNDQLFSDLEDSYQAHAAMAEGCDAILTIDIKHFKNLADSGSMEILNPQGFIERYLP